MQMWTPTQLIYHAAMQTPEVTTATGKVVKYEPFPAEEVEDAVCFLCGGETNGKGQSTKKAIKKTFTDHPYARALGSQAVCEACAFCLSHRELRNYAIVATKKQLLHPARDVIRDMLIEPPEPPFVMCIATSGQKWLHFKSQVNYSREAFAVNLEESCIQIVPLQIREMVEMAEYLYTTFTKDEILTGSYNQKRIKDFGLDRFVEYEGEVAKIRGSQIFELAVFVAQKQELPEEEKQEVKQRAPAASPNAGRKANNQGPLQIGFNWA